MKGNVILSKKNCTQNGQDLVFFLGLPEMKSWPYWGHFFLLSKSQDKVKILLNKVEILCYALLLQI